MSSALHVHHFGPANGAPVLALHGIGGYGGRWWSVAEHLPNARIIAPDLRGHGYSPYEPPWSFEQHVADLLALLDADGTEPVVLVGHSYGAAIAVHLARAAPKRLRGLLLLDCAMAIPASAALDCAQAYCAPAVFDDASDAIAEQQQAWSGVGEAAVKAEVTHHLARLPDGRLTWRICTPAMVASWSELARPFVVPPAGLRTMLVRAGRVDPPYVPAEFVAACTTRLGRKLETSVLDSGHMIEQEHPEIVAAMIDALLREPPWQP